MTPAPRLVTSTVSRLFGLSFTPQHNGHEVGPVWWFSSPTNRCLALRFAEEAARRAVDAALADAFASVADRVAMP